MSSKSPVSIFNDVIGPVMRGPSSSHYAAALRIGRLARDLMGGQFTEVLVEFDRTGSLPTTHDSQGSDMGLFGGLMGWGAVDERLPGSPKVLRDLGVQIRTETVDAEDSHPNTYRLMLRHGQEHHFVRAISTGGGMMEVLNVDGFTVSMFGDCLETLRWVRREGHRLAQQLATLVSADSVLVHGAAGEQLVEVKGGEFVSEQLICFTDLLATFAEICGATLPDDAGPGSFSLLPVLEGVQPADKPIRAPIVMHAGSAASMMMIRSGDWKLSNGLGSGGFTKPSSITPKPGEPAAQLYNLRTAPAETTNLAPRHLDGLMDEVRIFNRALTAEEINATFTAHAPTNSRPLQFRVLPSGPPWPRPFGAFYTRLNYCPEWDRIWPVGDFADVLVCFDALPVRMVLWRGTGYCAAWVTEDGKWVSDQGPESWNHYVLTLTLCGTEILTLLVITYDGGTTYGKPRCGRRGGDRRGIVLVPRRGNDGCGAGYSRASSAAHTGVFPFHSF